MRDERGLTTEDYMRAVTVGERTPHRAAVELEEYDGAWPERFCAEEERIRGALGERASQVEHVGSTSVPGLAAKPIIDLVLVVADSAQEEDYVPALEETGYVLTIREPEWFEHRLLKTPERDVNLHVFSAGCEEVERMLAFRDHLRANDDDRLLYERTKRELAAQTWEHVQHYADSKTEVVEQIMQRARSS
jgi:GrpB-like predicted nucleotidyltransferase (UPF0157 family)